jgi:hypothetical protein
MKTFGYAGGRHEGRARKLKRRGLRGVKLVISNAHKGIKAAVAKLMNATLAAFRVHAMRNALAHAGESSRRVVSALMATAFAQDGAEAAESARHRLPSSDVAGDRAPPGDGRPAHPAERDVLFRGGFRGVRRASADAGHSPTAKGSAGDLVGSTMDVEETVILRVSSRVEYEPSPFLALPAADEGPRGIGELHRCVRHADGVDDVLGCNDESSSFGERLRENMEGRGRDGHCRPPPAQIPAGAANAPGSHLGW